MICERVREQLTAYLDGDLDADRGSAVRGHLRGCEACRTVAHDEAALRDGLRALPPVDPPPSLWAGVQQRLAAAEVADAERPAWRRALSRWLMPQQLWMPGLAIATIVALLVWKTHRSDDLEAPRAPVADQHVVIAPSVAIAPPAPVDHGDVTEDLAAAPARQTASYADSAAELKKAANEARASWPADRQAAFDARVAALDADIAHADDGRPRQRAYRALIRYLQGAAIRDEVALR